MPIMTVEDSEPEDLAEIFSVPRVVPFAGRLGLKATYSVDLLTGIDLLHWDQRVAVAAEVQRRRPQLLILSPPCTMYSQLNQFLNFAKADPEQLALRKGVADCLMAFSMHLAEEQARPRRCVNAASRKLLEVLFCFVLRVRSLR